MRTPGWGTRQTRMPLATSSTVASVQQTKTVKGTVSDAMGPVIGATVMEKGTTNGAVTDFDGNFSLNVKPGATLVMSFIGFVTQEIAVGNQDNFDITLKEDSKCSRKWWSWVTVSRRRNWSLVPPFR